MDIITDKSFKYDHEKLDPASDEFIFVKHFYNTTTKGVIKYTYQDKNVKFTKWLKTIQLKQSKHKATI